MTMSLEQKLGLGLTIEFTKTDERAIEPRNAYGNDAGWDLFVLEDTRITWNPMKPVTEVRTGIAVAIPDGYFGRIVHRSSTPRKKFLQVVEGTTDAGYRGELMAGVMSLVEEPPIVRAGDSICQLIIQRVELIRFKEVDELPESLRGTKGYGSSGN